MGLLVDDARRFGPARVTSCALKGNSMRIEGIDLILALAAALEEGASEDGTHLGPTDSRLCARALRLLAATSEPSVNGDEKPEAA